MNARRGPKAPRPADRVPARLPDDAELYAGFPIAVRLRCAGARGRCSRLRGLALAFPERRDDDVVLLVTTAYGALWYADDEDGPGGLLLEGLVRSDFGGVLPFLPCPIRSHNEVVYEGARRLNGGAGMPARTLRPHFQRFRRGLGTQSLRWTQGRGPVAQSR